MHTNTYMGKLSKQILLCRKLAVLVLFSLKYPDDNSVIDRKCSLLGLHYYKMSKLKSMLSIHNIFDLLHYDCIIVYYILLKIIFYSSEATIDIN